MVKSTSLDYDNVLHCWSECGAHDITRGVGVSTENHVAYVVGDAVVRVC